MRRDRDPEAGVSLLEVLLALAIFGMIGAALASMMATGARVWDRTAVLGDVAEEGAARLRLRERMEGMPEVSRDWPLARLFAAGPTEVRFVPALAEEGEPAWSVLRYDEVTGQLSYLDGVLAAGTSPQVLYGTLKEAIFTFYGRPSVYEEARWSEAWEGAVLLPLLVKVETRREDGTPNPPLTIRPAKRTGQLEMSASSLVPPAWPSAP